MDCQYIEFKKKFKANNQGLNKKQYWLKFQKEWEQFEKTLRDNEKFENNNDSNNLNDQLQPQPFKFKQFTVLQKNTVFQVGTDGVLLGAWSECQKAQNIFEIGTGTGLISLMMAQRNSAANFEAIEILKDGYELAQLNFSNSPWKDKMKVYNSSLQEYKPDKKYDLIVCAPPYFLNSTLSVKTEKNTARHQVTLTYEEIINFSKMTLTEDGMLSTIIPYSHYEQFQHNTEQTGILHVNKILLVKGSIGSDIKRVLIQVSRFKTKIESKELVIENSKRHDYSDDFTELTKDYYLKQNYF